MPHNIVRNHQRTGALPLAGCELAGGGVARASLAASSLAASGLTTATSIHSG